MEQLDRKIREAAQALSEEFGDEDLSNSLLRLSAFAGNALAAHLEGDTKALCSFLVNVSAQAKRACEQLILKFEHDANLGKTAGCR